MYNSCVHQQNIVDVNFTLHKIYSVTPHNIFYRQSAQLPFLVQLKTRPNSKNKL